MLFKQPDIPKFHYTPRYYDEKKEQRARREKNAQQDNTAPLSTEEQREAFRERLHERFAENSIKNRGSFYSSSTFRFFMILILLIIAMLFLYAKYGDALISFFAK